MGLEAWATAIGDSDRLDGVEAERVQYGLQLSRQGDQVRICEPRALLDDRSLLSSLGPEGPGLLLVGDAPAGLLETLPEAAAVSLLQGEPTAQALVLAVEGLLERVALRRQSRTNDAKIGRYAYERNELVEIARAISQEREIETLLELILERSRYITGADAGSIYVVEDCGEAKREKQLRFKLSQNDSVSFESSEFTVPLSTRSIAGATAVTKQAINLADVDEIGEDVPYAFDRRFDKRVGYHTVSMLTMPMVSGTGDCIGVIQLINKKRDGRSKLERPSQYDKDVIAFDERSEGVLTTLAAQAGIALENALLYDEIRSIFEGFVRASVQAIEQRDPTTSGHSLRVSVFSCQLAETVDRIDSGPFAATRFSRRDVQELNYASLLHDFGKIGVREEVLVKAKKLYPHERESIRSRMEYAIKSAESDALQGRLELMGKGAGQGDLDRLEEEFQVRRSLLVSAFETIEQANEPTVLSEGDFSRINEIASIQYLDLQGNVRNLLSPEEVVSLHITRGSLSPPEIDEIRSHVVHTYDFLARIPWGKTMARVPLIAGAHHEKLNGSGYPHGITAEEIPLQSKIMTIADIYDALTARDRPYKKALAAERALQILGFEVKDGNLDPSLVQIFTEAEIFKAADGELEY